MYKKILSIILVLTMVVSMICGCGTTQTMKTVETTAETVKEVVNEVTNQSNSNVKKGATYLWNTKNDKYENFTDLGHYVIDVDRHTSFDLQKALDYANTRYDLVAPTGKTFGCTSLATHAPNGDVLIGRNCDLTVSQLPCFITHTKFGKYEQLNWTYDQLNVLGRLTYKEVLEDGKIDPDYYNALPILSTDSMNEEGLFMEYNMRNYEEVFTCYGTNPGKLRTCTICVPCLVTANCKTVKEAVAYMRNELDLYTCAGVSAAHGWNMCYIIGDATGEYGLIEVAKDEVKYMPYQHGQGNYYIWPTFNAITEWGTGYGRFQYGMDHIDEAVDEESMLELMSHIMWKNEVYGIKNSYRDEEGHLHFIDRDGKETMDWRDDFDREFLIDENGKMVEKSGYEDDHAAYLLGDTSKEDGYNKHEAYRDRCNPKWLCDDKNFEVLKAAVDKKYTEEGVYEKLDKYYAGDEDPLRNDSKIWTTALSFGVNCTKKSLTLRLWEHEDTVMKYQW